MDKISVIIPVYNTAKYLKRCIDSVIYQTYQNIEIILINDGSNDGSEYICLDYAKKYKNIIFINQCENHGVSFARNIGLKAASGDYYGFVDSDDYIEPNMYNELYMYISKYNSDIASCLFNHVWIENGKEMKKAVRDDHDMLFIDKGDVIYYYIKNMI